ncbi:hypothetical protein [Metapseudomonas otitidis]|nr:hypothetical protein [Pseudomonas otitidis]
MTRLRHLLALCLLPRDERALLQHLRHLAEADRRFILRAVAALAQHPTA